MSLQQERDEVAAFRRFLQCGALQIDESSIESRRFPEPDVLGATTSGARIAFELVEIVDPSWARLNSERGAVESQFHAALSQQALKDPLFAEGYRNAIGAIQFSNSGARRQAAEIAHIVEALNSLPMGFEGSLDRRAPAMRDLSLSELRVSREPGGSGPTGQVLAVASVEQPVVRQIEGKWHKTYETPHPIELLGPCQRV